MAVNTQFSIAVHLMAGLAHRGDRTATSSDLAASINTSPSFVRRVLAKLSKAGLVDTATGQAGACWLARKPRDVSLLDIYKAVDAPRVFAIHGYEARKECPVSCNIKRALDKVLKKTQKSAEATLKTISLASIVREMETK